MTLVYTSSVNRVEAAIAIVGKFSEIFIISFYNLVTQIFTILEINQFRPDLKATPYILFLNKKTKNVMYFLRILGPVSTVEFWEIFQAKQHANSYIGKK